MKTATISVTGGWLTEGRYVDILYRGKSLRPLVICSKADEQATVRRAMQVCQNLGFGYKVKYNTGAPS